MEIKYIATPIFLQQLGAFSPYKPASGVVNEFISRIPDDYKLIRPKHWSEYRF